MLRNLIDVLLCFVQSVLPTVALASRPQPSLYYYVERSISKSTANLENFGAFCHSERRSRGESAVSPRHHNRASSRTLSNLVAQTLVPLLCLGREILSEIGSLKK